MAQQGRATVLGAPPPGGLAVFSPDGKYRYYLQRQVPGGGPRGAAFVMLNPSTADHRRHDPTIRKCLGFCRRWGCGTLHVVNLFGLKSTDPAQIRQAEDPVGPDNLNWLFTAVRCVVFGHDPGVVVCAWGNQGAHHDHDLAAAREILKLCQPVALGFTRGGHPRHPLYVPYSTDLVPFRARTMPSIGVSELTTHHPGVHVAI